MYIFICPYMYAYKRLYRRSHISIYVQVPVSLYAHNTSEYINYLSVCGTGSTAQDKSPAAGLRELTRAHATAETRDRPRRSPACRHPAGRVITKNTPALDARQADADPPEKCSAGPPRRMCAYMKNTGMSAAARVAPIGPKSVQGQFDTLMQ